MLQDLINYLNKNIENQENYSSKLSEILQKPKKVIGTDASGGALNLLQLGDIFKD